MNLDEDKFYTKIVLDKISNLYLTSLIRSHLELLMCILSFHMLNF
jgi:hypothetical protein